MVIKNKSKSPKNQKKMIEETQETIKNLSLTKSGGKNKVPETNEIKQSKKLTNGENKPTNKSKSQILKNSGMKESLKDDDLEEHMEDDDTDTDEGEDVSDEGEDVSDKGEDVSDEGEDVSDKGEDVSDEGEDVSDEGEDVSDKGEDVSDEGEDVSDEEEDVSDEGEDVSDEGEDVSEEGEDVSDEGEDVSDEGEDVCDEEEKVTGGGENEEDTNGDSDEDEDLGEMDASIGATNSDSDSEDQSYFDDEDEDNEDVDASIVSKKLISKTVKDLAANSLKGVRTAQHLLASAILSIKGCTNVKVKSKYTLKGAHIFNDVIRMCITNVAPCLNVMFGMKNFHDKPKKNLKWKKLFHTIKRYLYCLITITKQMTERTAIHRLLEAGILPLMPLFNEFPVLKKTLLKHVVKLWSTSAEEVKILSVIIIYRILKGLTGESKDKAMKLMYMTYVKNCHFTSPGSWPSIDFMRDSLAELYNFDQNIAYNHAFIYIRQLALYLRNAMDTETADRIRLIANWQYLHCLHLWAEVLGKAGDSAILNPLIYPLVQVSIGSMNLLKSPKYYPYIFHVTNMLTSLSRNTGTYIPVAPHLLQILEDRRLHSKAKKTSLKPFVWPCIFKVSPAQLEESAFPDGLVEQIYDGLVNFLSSQSHYISFPEIVLLVVRKLKVFTTKCRFANYSKKMKQLLDKIVENSEFIENRRKTVDFKFDETKAIRNWEIETSQANPPLISMYKSLIEAKKKQSMLEEGTDDSLLDETPLGNHMLEEGTDDSLLDEASLGNHLYTKRDAQELENSSDDDQDIDFPVDSDSEHEQEIKISQKSKGKNKKKGDSSSPPKKKKKGDSSSPAKKKKKGDSSSPSKKKMKKDVIRPLVLEGMNEWSKTRPTI